MVGFIVNVVVLTFQNQLPYPASCWQLVSDKNGKLKRLQYFWNISLFKDVM
jgi:hypothetical protein